MKPKQEDSKEMVGGCCVCSDENGWTENPLVYCDGQGCTVAVHQACYGIVTVPTGSWFCRKCESQERAARVSSGGRRIFSQRCELCPSKDGALKRTDSGGWAHVVCALYIPEVRFGNVTTMEPIMLQLIPQERFNKSCYICEDSGKESRATIGACMQCNKSGCKQHFHVTCAQSLGLLCEEAGNYLDNVKYCGYCQYHFSKLRKGSHVKTIPPYRPVPHETGVSDEEKDNPKLKRKTGRPSAGNIKALGREEIPGGSASSPPVISDRSERGHISTSNSSELSSVNTGSSSLSIGSGSVGSVVSKAESLSKVSEPSSVNSASHSSTLKHNSSVVGNTFSSSSLSGNLSLPTSSPLTPTFTTSLSSVMTTFSSVTTSPSLPSNTNLSLSSSSSIPSSVLVSTVSSIITSATSSTLTTTPSPSTSGNMPHNSSPSQVSVGVSNQTTPTAEEKDKQERNRKLRRNGPRTPSGNSNFGDTESIVSNEDTQSSDLVLNICEEKNLSAEKESNKVNSKPSLDSSDDGGSLNVQFTPNISSSKGNTDPYTPTSADFATSDQCKRGRSNSQERGRRAKRGTGKRGRPGSGRDNSGRDSGASSPDSFTSESAPKRTRKSEDSVTKESPTTTSIITTTTTTTTTSTPSVITNGLSTNTLLLGNELNPASAVAQKMTDTLHAELEAHAIFKEEDSKKTLLIGPAIPGKKENANSNGSVSGQPPPFPQSLEQLLERQWEQGSQFLMEQAQHFDIASLLSCLHQLREENVRLEETVNSLIARRDHLLAVNARLSVPLSSPTTGSSTTSGSGSTSSNPPPPTAPVSVTSAPPPPSSSVPSHSSGNPRPSSSGSVPAPPPSRPHSQGHHPQPGVSHSGPPVPSPVAGGGHRVTTSPHDRRGPSPHERRGTSPHDRRAAPQQIPIENGLGETDYRYRSPGTEHRQQSPMLPPGAPQPSSSSLRHSPASGNYHTSVSPHAVSSLSPSGSQHSHAPPSGHPPPPPPGHIGSSHGPPSHGSPHGPPHVSSHGPPPMVSVAHSVAHSSAHTVAISRPSDHRGELVRMHTGPPPPPPPQGLGPGSYPVYQMVPGPHHSPVQAMNQPHPPPHAQVMRHDSGRPTHHGPMEKR